MYNHKFLFALVLTFTSSLCVAQNAEQHSSHIVNSAIQIAAQTKCKHDLDDFAAWKIAAKLMSHDQKQQKKSQICKCVGKNAPTVLSPSELALAAVDSKARTTLTGVAVAKTMNACVSEVLK